MATRQYIGARYIPKFADPVEWDVTKPYEYLTMVQHVGETYMSKQNVPIGAPLPDVGQGVESTEYWVHMSNWNAQVESYRQEVLALASKIPDTDFDSVNTVKKAIDDAMKVASNCVLMSAVFSDLNAFITAYPESIIIIDDGNYAISTAVTIPSGITLIPAGGVISTTNTGSLTIEGRISPVRSALFAADITLTMSGDENPIAYPEWFGAIADNVLMTSENVAAFTKSLSVFDTVELARANYYVSDTITIDESDKSIIGSEFNTAVSTITCSQHGIPIIKIGSEIALQADVISNICIDNVNVVFATEASSRSSIGVLAVSAINIRLDNMFIQNAGVCVKASNLVYSRFDNVYCEPSSTASSIGFYFTDIAAWYFGVGTNASLYINHCNVTPANYNANAYSMHFDGRGIADTFVDQFECSNSGYCINIDTTNSSGLEANSDVHFKHVIAEQIPRAIYISGAPIPLQMYVTDCYFCGKWDGNNNELVSIYPGYSGLALAQIVLDGCLFVVSSSNTSTKGIIAHVMGLEVIGCMFRYIVECVTGNGNYNSFDFTVYNSSRTATAPYVDFNGYRNTFKIVATADSASPVATYAIAGQLTQSTFYTGSIDQTKVSGLFDTSYSELDSMTEFSRNGSGNTYID